MEKYRFILGVVIALIVDYAIIIAVWNCESVFALKIFSWLYMLGVFVAIYLMIKKLPNIVRIYSDKFDE